MNIKNVLLLVATLLCPAVSFAVCPVEHSTVFYVNGIAADRKDTELSRKRLEKVLYLDPRATADCVSVKSAYNYSANEAIPHFGIMFDLYEAGIQKASETQRTVSAFTRSLLRIDDAQWIDTVLDDAAEGAFSAYTIPEQIAEHLLAYQTEAQTSGTLILAGHSQGNYYSNEEWNMLSAAAKQRVHLVAVATPATSVADNGPHVTLAQDNWAAGVFALFGAPRANVSNDEPCIGNFNDRWNCHGWKESYMNGANSREKIVNDIVALLPQTNIVSVSGLVTDTESSSPVAGADVSICRLAGEGLDQFCETTLSTTTSGSDGRYQFSNIPECSPCRVEAFASISNTLFVGWTDFILNTGDAVTADILMGPVLLQ